MTNRFGIPDDFMELVNDAARLIVLNRNFGEPMSDMSLAMFISTFDQRRLFMALQALAAFAMHNTRHMTEEQIQDAVYAACSAQGNEVIARNAEKN